MTPKPQKIKKINKIKLNNMNENSNRVMFQQGFKAGQEAKGSSWREGYQRGQEDILEKIEHENNKLLDGFNHQKDCDICKKLIEKI